ncbi:MAG: ATP-binding cassette domain-containing protein [Deferribacteraceae bacterium]|nr:ATP-binding cassette domain-containing protein [Deferribacteraceae bacterium]
MQKYRMLSLTDISKSFGARKLFDRVSFTINSGNKFGLVGRNGDGKSTLLKIIAGIESADTGDIITPRGYTIGILNQTAAFTKSSVELEALSVLGSEEEEYTVEKILFGLGFTTKLLQLSPKALSNGFQLRLMLAMLLIKNPNLLLLDEPTNYLDILAIRWLKSFLNSWKGELILITHDRAFMDSIAAHIIGIHRGKVKLIKGDTQKYYNCIALEEEVYEKTRINEEAKRKETELYISRFRAKARLANLVQSRIKTLAKQVKREKLSKIEGLDFSFNFKPIVSKSYIQAESVAFGYDKPLFSSFRLTLSEGDRLCVIGKNGLGKSTLLKILAGKLEPVKGEVLKHAGVNVGYYEQLGQDEISANTTVEEEVAKSANYLLERSAVRKICAALLFSGEDALKKVNILSGGELARVALAKLAVNPQSILILDEPTNHLDMDATDALLTALLDFDGPIIMATHNETLLYSLANRLIVFQGGEPIVYEMGYAEFLERVGFIEETKKQPKAKKVDRRIRAETISEKSRTLSPLKEKINLVQDSIITCEDEEKALILQMQSASDSLLGRQIADIGLRLKEVKKDIDSHYDELNKLCKQHDELERYYNAILDSI